MSPDRETASHRLRGVSFHLGLLLGFAALAMTMLWPLPLHLGSHVLKTIYYWDAYTNTMLLSSRVAGLFEDGPLGPYENYFFAPIKDTIVFNENLFGLSLMYAPLLWLGNNPLLAYNLTLLASFVLSQYFTYLLVRHLTGSHGAGIVSGFAFALSPYATFEMGRIQLVAQQWIPLCILFLYRACQKQRLADVIGLFLSYALLVGTCLYYAMFLAPLLFGLGLGLHWRRAPSLRFVGLLLAVGIPTALLIAAMIAPYFSARHNFDLTRTADFAARFDGQLGFFFNVHSTNHTWTSLHHHTPDTARSAVEEIAFPSFTIFALSALGLALPLVAQARAQGLNALLRYVALVLISGLLAVTATVVSHDMLAGLLVLGLVPALRLGPLNERLPRSPYAPIQRTQNALFLLSVSLFLGMQPWSFEGSPIRGLYYYLYTYAPGMDGIRKVSRQACLTTLWFSLLASIGTTMLLNFTRNRYARAAITVTLVGLLLVELRTFPHSLQPVWAGKKVPQAYLALAAEESQGAVAVAPTNFGRKHLRGQAGLALHNYMAVYHRHRTVNGKSSYIPPATQLAQVALAHLPHPVSLAILRQLGTGYLLVHGEEYDVPYRRWLFAELAKRPDSFRLLNNVNDLVRLYQLLPDEHGNGPSGVGLLPTPPVPAGAGPLPEGTVKANHASVSAGLEYLTDGNRNTLWSTRAAMRRGQFIEFNLGEPARLAMVELQSPSQPIGLPISYRMEVATGLEAFQTVALRPGLSLYRDQVHSPLGFTLRIPLPSQPVAQRVRLSVEEPVPGHAFTVSEAVFWALPRP